VPEIKIFIRQSYQQILAWQEAFTKRPYFDETHNVGDNEWTVWFNRDGFAIFKKKCNYSPYFQTTI